MLKVLALFPNTLDPALVEDILSKIVTAFKGVDGLLSLKTSEGNVMSPGGPPLYSKVFEASFVSLEAFMAWVETPAAKAQNDMFVEHGIVRLFYEENEL